MVIEPLSIKCFPIVPVRQIQSRNKNIKETNTKKNDKKHLKIETKKTK